MQTFLVDADFEQSARFLDNARLNKQLLEGRQILTALAGDSAGWRNHPATLMWAGHELFLGTYLWAISDECKARGIDTVKNDADINRRLNRLSRMTSRSAEPRWYKDSALLDRVLITHRASLHNKDEGFYATFHPERQMVDDDKLSLVCCPEYIGPRGGRKKGCDYYWPSHKGNV